MISSTFFKVFWYFLPGFNEAWSEKYLAEKKKSFILGIKPDTTRQRPEGHTGETTRESRPEGQHTAHTRNTARIWARGPAHQANNGPKAPAHHHYGVSSPPTTETSSSSSPRGREGERWGPPNPPTLSEGSTSSVSSSSSSGSPHADPN